MRIRGYTGLVIHGLYGVIGGYVGFRVYRGYVGFGDLGSRVPSWPFRGESLHRCVASRPSCTLGVQLSFL